MGRTHDYGIVVGKTRIFRVGVECGASVVHGRPQIVGPEPEKEFEHLFICLRAHFPCFLVEGLFGPFRPSAEPLVIYEYAPVLHGRLLLHEAARPHKQFVLMARDHICPPVPGRHSDLLAQRGETECCAPSVASDDDKKRSLVAWVRCGDNHVRLPFPGNPVCFQSEGEPVDKSAVPESSGNDCRCCGKVPVIPGSLHLSLDPGDSLHIIGQHPRCNLHHLEIVFVYVYVGSIPGRNHRETCLLAEC